MAFKLPVNDHFPTGLADIRGAATEILKRAQLQPEPLEPRELLDTMRTLFNERAAMENDAYDIPKPKGTPAFRPQMLILPCLGYGPGGVRMGYGGGFYRRTPPGP